MATVYLTTTHPHSMGSCETLRRFAADDPFREHGLTDDPEAADLILFVESLDTWQSQIHARRHPLVRRFREKTFAQSEFDLSMPFLPGIYPSISSKYHTRSRTRGGSYISMFYNPFVGPGPLPETPYLFVFAGNAKTAPKLRSRILRIDHPEAHVEDTAARAEKAFWSGDAEEKAAFQSRYADLLRSSLFALCPRGVSPAAVRIFEAMKTGRVPVVLSDEWTAPDGPDWDAFSIRIPEREADHLPAILEARRTDAPSMGRLAREAWEEWFAPEVLFHRTVESCLSIQQSRRLPERLLRWRVWRQVAMSPYRRVFLRELWLDMKSESP